MEPFVTLIALGAWAGTGLLASRLLSREAVTRRRLKRSQPVPVREFPAGRIAKVVGAVRYISAPLVAPLSGRRCAFYQVWVRTADTQLAPGAPPTEWRGQDFLLVDRAGVGALVRVAGADVAITRDVRAAIGIGGDDPRARAYLHALASRNPYVPTPNPPLEILEGVLEEGEVVAACGVGLVETDPVPDATSDTGAAGYRALPQRLILRATEKNPLLLSDDPLTTR